MPADGSAAIAPEDAVGRVTLCAACIYAVLCGRRPSLHCPACNATWFA